jgi:signal transduction histidine kinase
VIEAGTYQQPGDIYGELNQFGRAVQYVQKALETARQAGNKGIVQDSYKSLSELYQAMKRPETAFEYLLAAYRIKDSTQSINFSRQLAEMEVKYQTEKKESEIKILKQQKQIDDLSLRQQQERLKRQELLLFSFAVLAIAIIVALYFYIQRRRLAEKVRRDEAIRQTTEAERLRIAKDIHDELGSGLSKIKLLADIALLESNENRGKLKQTVDTISNTSSGLIENMRDLVWAMNPENSNLQNLIARIREYSDEYFEDLPIDLTMDIPEDVPAIPISKELNRNVFMILKEALQNIVKHSSATAITIKIELKPRFRMEIEDNGKGFDTGTKHEGNGLTNMKTRSEAIGGHLYVKTESRKGVKLAFEVNKALPL